LFVLFAASFLLHIHRGTTVPVRLLEFGVGQPGGPLLRRTFSAPVGGQVLAVQPPADAGLFGLGPGNARVSQTNNKAMMGKSLKIYNKFIFITNSFSAIFLPFRYQKKPNRKATPIPRRPQQQQ
jgi:hypothetical protein